MINISAIAETLIQLSENRQYQLVDALIPLCSPEQLVSMASLLGTAATMRTRYILQQYVERGASTGNSKLLTHGLVRILNRWCAQGQRTSLRRVLNALDQQALLEIAEAGGLDAEISSIIREYKSRYPSGN